MTRQLRANVIQISDTHILPRGELLYGITDTAAHLAEVVRQIQDMRPVPELVLVTGDVVDWGDHASYRHFIDIIEPLEMPVRVLPGNHDDPTVMLEVFGDTDYFPAMNETCQYAVDGLPFRVLALNTRSIGTELPEFSADRFSWLENQLNQSDKPVLIAMHHPPMITGIEFVDMAGTEWFQAMENLLAGHPQVKLLICGHAHADLSGRIAHVPVYMASSTAHQLIAARGLEIAPSALIQATAPVLHQFIDGEFLSGSYLWPANADEKRIDKESGRSWEELKNSMRGSRTLRG